jgi:hypothetical protein
MSPHLFKIYIIGFLLALGGPAEAQKNIIISDSLAANADKLKVNLGSLWMGEIRKFSFGDYAIVSSKRMGVTTESSKNSGFNTQTAIKARNFSFVLNDKTTDSASVKAGTQSTIVQSLTEFGLGNGWFLGHDEQVESNDFAVLITVNRDTSETWALFMGGTSHNETGNYQAYLTNGKRRVLLALASSNKKVQNTNVLNAVGYEFIENGQSLCALQYYGGGLGKSSNIVWIHRSLDAKMKLILASAMTAILLVSSPLSPIN